MLKSFQSYYWRSVTVYIRKNKEKLFSLKTYAAKFHQYETSFQRKVYGNPTQILTCENSWLCERAILTPQNDQAAAIKAAILSLVAGDNVEYISINRVMEERKSTSYPVEFLESLRVPRLPAHKIKLKIGVPIMLLRNLSPPKLCNGTRLKVTTKSDRSRDFNRVRKSFKRIQFPVSLCFAMTINKAQGQTLKVVGVDKSQQAK
uniref:SFRICE_040210 n=1 Tax=Spodoptera frugiperda TaxID=7108 RepID=A0A2H1VET5_SPOFR